MTACTISAGVYPCEPDAGATDIDKRRLPSGISLHSAVQPSGSVSRISTLHELPLTPCPVAVNLRRFFKIALPVINSELVDCAESGAVPTIPITEISTALISFVPSSYSSVRGPCKKLVLIYFTLNDLRL